MKLNFYSIYNLFRLILVDQQCLSPNVLTIFVCLHTALLVFNIVPSSCLLLLKLGQNGKKKKNLVQLELIWFAPSFPPLCV